MFYEKENSMKIVKLFLLLTFVLWADFKLDISNDINVSQLENIVKNGWNDSNKTLNNLIVSNAERIMPEILEKIKKPILKGIVTEKDSFPISRILLSRDDYSFIFAYCKYLEFNSEIDKALNLYMKSLMGLNNIEDKTILSAIFHLVIEEMIIDNLKRNTTVMSKLEYAKLEKILILNTDILRDALREEEKNMIEILTLNAKLPKEILILIRKYSNGYIKAYMKIKNKEELTKIEKKYNKYKNKIEAKYYNWTEKNIIPKDIARDELIASYIFLIGLPKFRLLEDVWKNIEKNKKLLDSL